MQPATRYIEAASHRQAMDWSLVLISQGIQSIVDRSESGPWAVFVWESDLEPALQAIRAYERENASRWRREVKWTGLLFDWRSALVFLLFIGFFAVTELVRPELKPAGRMDRGEVLKGEWWRPFTAVTLHADIGHLAANVATGIVLLGFAMGAYGPGHALLASFLAGAGANIFAMVARGEAYRSLGASGMVMGALGVLTVHSVASAGGQPLRQWIGRGLLAGVLLFVLLGLDPQSDVLAHLGGFIGGCFLGLGLNKLPVRWRSAALPNASTALATAVAIVVPWALAIARH